MGVVKAGGSADLDECPNIQSISAGNHVTLRQSAVQGNVSSGSDVTVENSKIDGTLTCSSNHLVIEGSQIDTIDLRCAGASIHSSGISFGNNVVSMGNVFVSGGSSISMSGGNIMIGSGTRSNNVFINGVPLSKLQSQNQSSSASNDVTKQVLELRNCTVRNIIFEGGKGEVILSGTSSVLGDITGGQVRS